ncbi:hypothetical protein SAMN05421807_13010 [Virgibacillus chiguensis]|uniref:Uncharacterized protein n=1 Tax=Virgibacillus chiguensis TaxID=411959 RepID=A0A1M5XN12_9BACI|nr:hypothetical protein SAMN05421807_13010 [Virgibacillus chiguensis]
MFLFYCKEGEERVFYHAFFSGFWFVKCDNRPTSDNSVVVRFSIPLSGSLRSVIVDTVKLTEEKHGDSSKMMEVFHLRNFPCPVGKRSGKTPQKKATSFFEELSARPREV